MADGSSITTKTGQQLGNLSELQTGDSLVIIRAGVPIGTIDATAVVDSVTASLAEQISTDATTASTANTSAQAAAGTAVAASESATTSATEAEESAASINGVARNAYDPSLLMVGTDNSVQERMLWAYDQNGLFSTTFDNPTATSLTSADKAHVDVHGLAHGSGERWAGAERQELFANSEGPPMDSGAFLVLI